MTWYTQPRQLADRLSLSEAQIRQMEEITPQFPMRIPEYYLGLIDPADPGGSHPEDVRPGPL